MENMISESPRRRGRRPKEDDSETQVVENSIPRVEMRSDMREESSIERAKRRTAELSGQLEHVNEGGDKFYVDADMIPEGWAYEWKRRLLLGAEDPSHMVELARSGWEPVPLNRDNKHLAMMPAGWAGNTIERDGMILMERPSEVVEEARRRHDYLARKQVRDKEAQIAGTPDGTLTRDHAQARPQIKKSYEAIPVPKD